MKKGFEVTESEKFHEKANRDIACFKKSQKTQEDVELKSKILHNWEKSMRDRRVFKYGYLSIFHYILCWVVCRRDKSLRTKPKFRDHVYFSVGQEKLHDELDCVTIIKSIRKLRILTQLLLTKKQKFLIKFQRDNVIDSSSSGTSDEGQLNIIDLMKSQNAKHKKIINEKIKNNISSFENKDIVGIDMRVIKGILKKRFSDDDYEDGSDSEINSNIDSEFVCKEGKWPHNLINRNQTELRAILSW